MARYLSREQITPYQWTGDLSDAPQWFRQAISSGVLVPINEPPLRMQVGNQVAHLGDWFVGYPVCTVVQQKEYG